MADWTSLLDKGEPLTEEELRELLRSAQLAGVANPWPRKLAARLAIEHILATRKFDRTSARLTIWLIVLTVVLVVLTGVIAWFTIVLAARH